MSDSIKKQTDFTTRATLIYNKTETELLGLFNEKNSSLRINPLKNLSYSEIINISPNIRLEKVPWYDAAYFIVSGRNELIKSEHFENGDYYIQNASSLLPPMVLNPKKDDDILAMCAAPGGKSFQILEMTNNKCNLVVNDSSPTRMGVLKRLLKQHGGIINAFYVQPAQYLTKHLDIKFNKILIDAPCSGEGMINLNQKDALNFWSIKKIKRLAKLQKRILTEATKLLKPGGEIVYSTCTSAPEENEEVIDYILNKNPNLKVKNIQIPLSNSVGGITTWNSKIYNAQVAKAVRIVPNENMQAFFVCKLIYI